MNDLTLAVTKVTPRGGAHRMDRIYVSPDVRVDSAGVDYGNRTCEDIAGTRVLTCGSDHALVWADVEMRI